MNSSGSAGSLIRYFWKPAAQIVAEVGLLNANYFDEDKVYRHVWVAAGFHYFVIFSQ